MDKNELIKKYAADFDDTQASAKKIVDGVVGLIAGALAKGEEVNLPGFGKFKVKDRPARPGRNPRTGEAMEFAASKNVGFSASKTLKDSL